MPREGTSQPPRVIGPLERAERGAVSSIAPAYLTAADYPWLRMLLEERARFVGHKRRVWRQRLAQPLGFAAPRNKLRLALGVLDRLVADHAPKELAARKVRAVVFREAAKDACRRRALERAASALDVAADALPELLFADLPEERALAPLAEPLGPDRLALLCNEALVSALLHKALRVRVVARGNVRAVVRHAKLAGLICRAALAAGGDAVILEISGPYALFRHTRVYGRALASLVPRLAWCKDYRLEADCMLGAEPCLGRLVLGSGDPIGAARELRPFDSKLEERFARAFGKLAPEWDLTREPRAVPVGDSLIFPDFELVHRATDQRWLLEIAGYWTPEYVRRKLALLRQAKLERLILCIDEERCCAEEALEHLGTVIRYRRRLDPRAVLAVLDPAWAPVPDGHPGRGEKRSPRGGPGASERRPERGARGAQAVLARAHRAVRSG
jgi:predicted nuclease of restriction endonuclease-like RecB superfamily